MAPRGVASVAAAFVALLGAGCLAGCVAAGPTQDSSDPGPGSTPTAGSPSPAASPATAAPAPWLAVAVNPKKMKALVGDHFLGLTMDPAELSEHRKLGPGAVRTLAMARGLAPAYLRLAGPSSDILRFTRGDQPSRNGTASEADLLAVARWARSAGWRLVLALNALRRAEDGSWDGRNAADLLATADREDIPLALQLGYDAGALDRAGVDGARLGADLARARTLLSQFPRYEDAVLMGPDVAVPAAPQAAGRAVKMHVAHHFLQDEARAAVPAPDVVVWQPWPQDADAAAVHDDSLDLVREDVNRVLGRAAARRPLWIAESDSAAPRTFGGALQWASRVQTAARVGADVIFRRWHDAGDDLQPTPDYWVSLLHRRLCGRALLDARLAGNRSAASVTAQCTAAAAEPDGGAPLLGGHPRLGYERGDVTLLAVNSAAAAAKLAVKLGPGVVNQFLVHEYILTAPGHDLGSRSALLNGEPLAVDRGGVLPGLRPRVRASGGDRGTTLELPPHSVAFFVFPGVRAAACQTAPPSAAEAVPLSLGSADQDVRVQFHVEGLGKSKVKDKLAATTFKKKHDAVAPTAAATTHRQNILHDDLPLSWSAPPSSLEQFADLDESERSKRATSPALAPAVPAHPALHPAEDLLARHAKRKHVIPTLPLLQLPGHGHAAAAQDEVAEQANTVPAAHVPRPAELDGDSTPGRPGPHHRLIPRPPRLPKRPALLAAPPRLPHVAHPKRPAVPASPAPRLGHAKPIPRGSAVVASLIDPERGVSAEDAPEEEEKAAVGSSFPSGDVLAEMGESDEDDDSVSKSAENHDYIEDDDEGEDDEEGVPQSKVIPDQDTQGEKQVQQMADTRPGDDGFYFAPGEFAQRAAAAAQTGASKRAPYSDGEIGELDMMAEPVYVAAPTTARPFEPHFEDFVASQIAAPTRQARPRVVQDLESFYQGGVMEDSQAREQADQPSDSQQQATRQDKQEDVNTDFLIELGKRYLREKQMTTRLDSSDCEKSRANGAVQDETQDMAPQTVVRRRRQVRLALPTGASSRPRPRQPLSDEATRVRPAPRRPAPIPRGLGVDAARPQPVQSPRDLRRQLEERLGERPRQQAGRAGLTAPAPPPDATRMREQLERQREQRAQQAEQAEQERQARLREQQQQQRSQQRPQGDRNLREQLEQQRQQREQQRGQRPQTESSLREQLEQQRQQREQQRGQRPQTESNLRDQLEQQRQQREQQREQREQQRGQQRPQPETNLREQLEQQRQQRDRERAERSRSLGLPPPPQRAVAPAPRRADRVKRSDMADAYLDSFDHRDEDIPASWHRAAPAHHHHHQHHHDHHEDMVDDSAVGPAAVRYRYGHSPQRVRQDVRHEVVKKTNVVRYLPAEEDDDDEVSDVELRGRDEEVAVRRPSKSSSNQVFQRHSHIGSRGGRQHKGYQPSDNVGAVWGSSPMWPVRPAQPVRPAPRPVRLPHSHASAALQSSRTAHTESLEQADEEAPTEVKTTRIVKTERTYEPTASSTGLGSQEESGYGSGSDGEVDVVEQGSGEDGTSWRGSARVTKYGSESVKSEQRSSSSSSGYRTRDDDRRRGDVVQSSSRYSTRDNNRERGDVVQSSSRYSTRDDDRERGDVVQSSSRYSTRDDDRERGEAISSAERSEAAPREAEAEEEPLPEFPFQEPPYPKSHVVGFKSDHQSPGGWYVFSAVPRPDPSVAMLPAAAPASPAAQPEEPVGVIALAAPDYSSATTVQAAPLPSRPPKTVTVAAPPPPPPAAEEGVFVVPAAPAWTNVGVAYPAAPPRPAPATAARTSATRTAQQWSVPVVPRVQQAPAVEAVYLQPSPPRQPASRPARPASYIRPQPQRQPQAGRPRQAVRKQQAAPTSLSYLSKFFQPVREQGVTFVSPGAARKRVRTQPAAPVQQADPWGQASPAADNLWGQPAAQADNLWGQPAAQTDNLWGQPQPAPADNLWGQPASSSAVDNIWGQPAAPRQQARRRPQQSTQVASLAPNFGEQLLDYNTHILKSSPDAEAPRAPALAFASLASGEPTARRPGPAAVLAATAPGPAFGPALATGPESTGPAAPAGQAALPRFRRSLPEDDQQQQQQRAKRSLFDSLRSAAEDKQHKNKEEPVRRKGRRADPDDLTDAEWTAAEERMRRKRQDYKRHAAESPNIQVFGEEGVLSGLLASLLGKVTGVVGYLGNRVNNLFPRGGH